MGVDLFGGEGGTSAQNGFGGGGEEDVDGIGETVEVGLESEEVVDVELVESGEVNVELGEGDGEGGDQCG